MHLKFVNANFRENLNLQSFTVIQRQSKAHMQLPILVVLVNYSNFGRISYHFRDIDA